MMWSLMQRYGIELQLIINEALLQGGFIRFKAIGRDTILHIIVNGF
ncbi:hypothetical protein [Paenibacillus sp. RS8]